MSEAPQAIGQLATNAGMTVRAVHDYHRLGLLATAAAVRRPWWA